MVAALPEQGVLTVNMNNKVHNSNELFKLHYKYYYYNLLLCNYASYSDTNDKLSLYIYQNPGLYYYFKLQERPYKYFSLETQY